MIRLAFLIRDSREIERRHVPPFPEESGALVESNTAMSLLRLRK